jgi:hypothetical protein
VRANAEIVGAIAGGLADTMLKPVELVAVPVGVVTEMVPEVALVASFLVVPLSHQLTDAAILIEKFRVFYGVALLDLRVEAVKHHVDVRNGPSIPNGFLTEEADAPRVAARIFHELGRVNVEAARAASWIVKRGVERRFARICFFRAHRIGFIKSMSYGQIIFANGPL